MNNTFDPVMADLAEYERQQDAYGFFCDRVDKIVEELLAGEFNPADPENRAIALTSFDAFQMTSSQIEDAVWAYWNDAAEELAIKMVDEEDEKIAEYDEQDAWED